MNRRLHNSYTAMLATGAALALGLMLASPTTLNPQPEAIQVQVGALGFSYLPAKAGVDNAERAKALTRSIERRADHVETLADAAALTAEIATAAALTSSLREIDQADATNDSPRSANKTRHRSRQTLAMPYFSFAPQG
ncbi:hypothetical protein J2X06_001652 [Lysobacter niastensis]|uniref:Uncharacterized protein n=1 Tax=Lysobacter niastensis TaxID=380629 RepID=A0ABU1WA90_9GAMM|nr:hypothetical protein [Lysobacter niastensis]MDR7134468.1 hypothetical protein [Lysobacter niastensis]